MVAQMFEDLRCEASLEAAIETLPSEQFAQHGMLPAAIRQELRARAIAEVILPCAAALTECNALRSLAA
jgi:hypothetical protein